MRRYLLVAGVACAISASVALVAAQPMGDGPHWRQWRGGPGWGGGPGMMGPGGGMMGPGGMGYSPRRPFAMHGGLPDAYARAENPLPRNSATVERGAQVYGANCASCHGATGEGDGPAAKDLDPRPANLAWLSETPIAQWDPYMFWTVSEGGAQFKTAMPAFKDKLSKEDIWSAIAYIQAQLPDVAKK